MFGRTLDSGHCLAEGRLIVVIEISKTKVLEFIGQIGIVRRQTLETARGLGSA